MKRNYLLAVLMLINIAIFAQTETKHTLKTAIDSITIYLEGAEINHSKQILLKEGRNKIIFEGLSPHIYPKSIRVTTPETVALLSITSKIDYLNKEEDAPRIKALRDSLDLLSKQEVLFADQIAAYTIEKEMLLKNTSLGGQNTGVSVAELKNAADFYRLRMLEINNTLSELARKQNKIGVKIDLLESELNELNAQSSYVRSEVEVLVSADKAISANIDLKYLVANAGWAPSYDIKAIDTDEPIDFIYRAKVFNNTAIDWNNVKIKLSTANPTIGVSLPVLKPWLLNFYSYNDYYNKYEKKKEEISQYKQANEGYVQNIESNIDDLKSISTIPIDKELEKVTFETIEVPELSAEFTISRNYSIPADSKPYLVDVAEYSLPATYKHFAVTKVDRDVFLLARITGWQELNLIQGPANVYYGGTYLGEAYVNTRNVSDTLNLSLGRDNKVMVTRTKLKDFSDKQLIGNKITETYVYEMVVKNNRKTAIEMELQDQIPVSQVEEIEVKALETSGAEYNANSGQLVWKIKLQPGQSQKIKLSFSIKYPKERKQEIYLEQKRSINAPMFK